MRLGAHGYTEDTAKVFYAKLHEHLRALPGIQGAALASWFPLGFEGGSSTGIVPEGYQRAPNEDMGAAYAIVSPDYFSTMRIPMLEGRDFTDRDSTDSERVAIINEAAARRFWPGRSALGQRFETWGGRKLTVIGIVKTGLYRSLGETPKSFLYAPYQQGVWDLNLGIVMRTEGDPAAQASALRDAVHAVDSAVEIWTTIPYVDFMQAAFLAQRIAATLLTALGIIATGLAALGIYGVMAYVVGQRTHEIGIRMALGADALRVLRLVLVGGARLAGLGLLVGLTGALLLSRWLSAFLQGVSPYDVGTFSAVAMLIALVSLAACALPALRAARVDPMVALRKA
jgi:predicted permease